MKAVTGKQFARLLEERGWRLMRVQGSHHIYARPGHAERISVPIHGNSSLKIGLQKHLMKLAKINEEDLP